MRVSLGWLAEWIDLPSEQEALLERLTLAGLEIEGVERTGPSLEGVVVGEVQERAPHPSADRLSVCRVALGTDEPLEVVCGAPNVAAGQKVAVARAGVRLPDGTRLEKARIRGVVSNGMICSERELGLGDEHEGILVLDAGAPVGAPLAQLIDPGDTIVELEITPNRGDWASLLGIAREVRAHFGGELRVPPCEPPENGASAAEALRVEVLDPEGCHRYAARVVRGVGVGPSPGWLVRRLELAGLRSLNVVVDVTNLVMLEFGQPLHGFDLARVRGGLIRVRRAATAEKLVTLDGETRALDPEDLVIADAEGAVAIAGVMGGADSEVRGETSDLLLESAHFAPARVRRTARRLGLRTDASYRFERGVDREGVRRALDRAARLIVELAGGRVAPGVAEALGSPPPGTGIIDLDPARVNRLLGTQLADREVADCLGRVDVVSEPLGAGRLRCRIPSYRNDLEIPADLVEEVARVHGYDRIAPTLPEARLEPTRVPSIRRLEDRARDALCGAGLVEVMSIPFQGAADLEALGLPDDDPRRCCVRIENPIVRQEDLLRSSFVPSLLRVVKRNLSRQKSPVRVFEVGRSFLDKGAPLPEERTWAAAAITRGDEVDLWTGRERPPLFFEARGVAERLALALGHEAGFAPGGAEPYLHPGAASAICAAGQRVGCVGELHPAVADRFEVDASCALIEFDLSALEATAPRSAGFREVSRQPAVRRDLAVLVERDRAAGDLLEAVRKTGGAQLVSVEIFDRYEGKGVPDGKVSLAFRLVFQRPDRTLTDAEVAKMTERVVQMLSHRFGGELR